MVPLLGLKHPEFPIGILAFMFLVMAMICGICWAILMWKKDALNQPPNRVIADA